MRVFLALLAVVICACGAASVDAKPKAHAKPAADAKSQLLQVEAWGGGALTIRAPKGWKLDPDAHDNGLTSPNAHDNGKLTSEDGLTTITFVTIEDAQPLGISASLHEMADLIAADNPDTVTQPKVSGREAMHLSGPSTDADNRVVRIDLLAIRLDPQRVAFAYATTPWSVAKSEMGGGSSSKLPGVRVPPAPSGWPHLDTRMRRTGETAKPD